MRWVSVALVLALVGCGSSDRSDSTTRSEAPSRAPEPTVEPPPAIDPPAPTAPDTAAQAPADQPVDQGPSVRVLDDCLWYADPSPPPLDGPGSLEELDQRITAWFSRSARVAGRVRLRARGCPRISAGVVMVGAAMDDDVNGLIIGDDPTQPPVAGERGDERRDRPFGDSGDLADDQSDCAEETSHYFFRAVHDASGAVREIELDKLGGACTLFAHDLQHGDLDRDGTTEIRVETWTSTIMDISAGAERYAVLVIYDLAELRRELTLEVGRHQLAEVEGYGGSSVRSDVAFRDLDEDGDRDLVVRRRWQESMRTMDDLDEEHYRGWSSEAYEYDAPSDEFRRASSLDARIPGARPR